MYLHRGLTFKISTSLKVIPPQRCHLLIPPTYVHSVLGMCSKSKSTMVKTRQVLLLLLCHYPDLADELIDLQSDSHNGAARGGLHVQMLMCVLRQIERCIMFFSLWKQGVAYIHFCALKILGIWINRNTPLCIKQINNKD